MSRSANLPSSNKLNFHAIQNSDSSADVNYSDGNKSSGHCQCIDNSCCGTGNMKSETRLLILRCFVAFCFFGAAALCGSLSYYLIHSIEYSNATKQYSNLALQALKLAELGAVSKRQGGQLLAKMYAWNVNATSWPNASIEGFQDISSTLIEMTTSLTLSMNPIVLPSDVEGFESFAYDFISDHPDEYTPSSGISSFGRGQSASSSMHTTSYEASIILTALA